MISEISYQTTGDGDPIIFIHGIGSRKKSWNGIVKELMDNYKCISYDLRGHGESKTDQNKFTLDDLVDDLEKLLSNLNIYKAHLVGHSLGGMIGPSFARKYEERVMSLTLLSTASFRTLNEQNAILNIITKIEKDGIDSVIPILVNRWFTDDFMEKNQEIINKRIIQVKNTPLKIFKNVFRIYALTDMSSWLKYIKSPSLVMTGENDSGCNPKINKKITQALPNSKLEILKNLKHAITLEAPKLVGTKINNFLKNIENYTTLS